MANAGKVRRPKIAQPGWRKPNTRSDDGVEGIDDLSDGKAALDEHATYSHTSMEP